MFRRTILFLLLSAVLAVKVEAGTLCSRIAADPNRWVGSSVDELVRSAHEAYRNEDAAESYDDVLGALARASRRCGLRQDVAFSTNYPEFLDYLDEASMAVQPGHQLGFNVSDRQYFAETIGYLGIPDFLMEPRFLRNVSRFETLRKAKQYLAQLNETRADAEKLVFFSYTSRHLGTPDNNDSYRRLLIVVPGDRAQGIPDKWVQFGVTDPGVSPRVRNVSVVSALMRDDGSYDSYFKDYFRTFHRNGAISVKGRLELGEDDENCVQCHKSGVLPIFPAKGSVPADEVALVDVVNERFRSYGIPRFGGYIDTAKLGPGLSMHEGEAADCSKCHNPGRLGYLNWPMDRIIVSSFVKGGQMPRGGHYSSADRKALYDRLVENYFSVNSARPGVFKSWLLGRSRDNP